MGKEVRIKRSGYNPFILLPTLILLLIGLVAIYSASSFLAQREAGMSTFYFKRQMIFSLTGILLMIGAKNFPIDIFNRYSWIIYLLLVFSLIPLVFLLIPGFERAAGGAKRWIHLGGFSFQPSEFLKLTLSFYIAYSMSKKIDIMKSFSKGFLPHIVVISIFLILIHEQPDLGTCIIISSWTIIMLFIGGARIIHIIMLTLASLPALIFLILKEGYRLMRWKAMLNPWEDPYGYGYQIIHSLIAFGSGGLTGVGLGNSIQKMFYLPTPHTDFIMSIIAEEVGFIGCFSVIFLFSILIYEGIVVSLNARDLFRSYLALGLVLFLALEVITNLGVVMGMLPPKGLTLPLISYGGSSLFKTLIAIGLLLNISSERKGLKR